jgi:hypothetical protein
MASKLSRQLVDLYKGWAAAFAANSKGGLCLTVIGTDG